jgi:hypothetical protein
MRIFMELTCSSFSMWILPFGTQCSTGNTAKAQGGAIFASGFNQLRIGEYTQIRENSAEDKGDDMYIVNTEAVATLDKVKFSNPNAMTCIYAEKVQLVMN